jgi:hypothetical protein
VATATFVRWRAITLADREPDLHHQRCLGVPLYLAKVAKKGRTNEELDQVIRWLTGFDEPALRQHLAEGSTFEDFFAAADLNPHATLITGVVCGVRVEDLDDPLMQKIRYLDKLVDELAKGKPLDKILRA